MRSGGIDRPRSVADLNVGRSMASYPAHNREKGAYALERLARTCRLAGATGVRAMMGPAASGWYAMTGRLPLDDTPFAMAADPDVVACLIVLEAGEIAADKLPFLPSRTAFQPLLLRIGLGSLVGAAVFMSEDLRWFRGAAIGAAAAAGAAFVSHRIRMLLMDRIGLPNALAGLVDDFLALQLARGALSGGSDPRYRLVVPASM